MSAAATGKVQNIINENGVGELSFIHACIYAICIYYNYASTCHADESTKKKSSSPSPTAPTAARVRIC